MSGIAVGRKGETRHYIGKVFYIPQRLNCWLMHFVIVRDLELCLKAVERFYLEHGAEAGPFLRVTFDGDEVSLDIPGDGITLPSGWSLMPLIYPPKLLRKDVDNYMPGHTIPCCQIEIDSVAEPANGLNYKLYIKGVSPSDTFLRISRNPTCLAADFPTVTFEKPEFYSVQTFYIPNGTNSWIMHFVITRNLELCLKNVKSFYSDKGVEHGPKLTVTFTGDEVSLGIPEEGITLVSGWRLTPLSSPKLLQKSVDSYQPGEAIPSCQIELAWTKVEEHPKELSHLLHIEGVTPPGSYIRITRTPKPGPAEVF